MKLLILTFLFVPTLALTQPLNTGEALTLSKSASLNEAVQPSDVNRVARLSNAKSKTYDIKKRFLEIGAEYPTQFGVNFKYYMFNTFYTRFGLSLTNVLFLESFQKVAPIFGYLNEHETKVIGDVLSRSFYTEMRLGWFPYFFDGDGGPYLEVGVSGTFLGGREMDGLNLNRAIETEEFSNNENYRIQARTINGTFHVGYQIPIERLTFNVEAGILKIINVEFEEPAQDDDLTGLKMNEDQEKTVKNFLETKGWIFPTVSASIGFSF